jgi:small subunit ribosomal protein S16
MAVKIRLSRAGKKGVPFHTVVVADSRKKRDGAIIENIGTYDGLNGKIVLFNEESYLHWISKGAQPTDSAKKVYKLHKKTGSPTPSQEPVIKPKKMATKKQAQSSTVDAQSASVAAEAKE